MYDKTGMERIKQAIKNNEALSKQDCAELLYSKKDWEWDYALPMQFVDRLINHFPHYDFQDFSSNLVYGYTRTNGKLHDSLPAYRMGYFLPITPKGEEILITIAEFTNTQDIWHNCIWKG